MWPPVAGSYAMALVKRGPLVPIRIFWGHAVIQGEEQDRGYDWRCEVNGATDRWNEEQHCFVPLDLDGVWPECTGKPIDDDEFAFMRRRTIWAVAHAPWHPAANPYTPIDLGTLPPAW